MEDIRDTRGREQMPRTTDTRNRARNTSPAPARKRASSKTAERMKRMCIVVLVAGVVGVVLVSSIVNSFRIKSAVKTAETTAKGTQTKLEKQITDLESELEDVRNGVEEPAEWNMVLVNTDHPMDTSYVPELATVGNAADNMQVDTRIADAVNKMLSDGAAAGLSMQICSAYRDSEKQKEIFNSTMQGWLNEGQSNYDAFETTKQSVQIPGCSEHATGLAVDIVSTNYTTLDEGQADTEEAKWLAAHCAEYGFILRYPPEKSDVTGIIYEPWHYRYVGDEAQAITDSGLTFEEYLEAKANGTLEDAAK